MTNLRTAIRALLAILVLSVCAIAVPTASAQSSSDSEVITSATLKDVNQALTDLGITYEESPMFPGHLRAYTAEGLVFHIGVTACEDDGTGCLGINMIGYWYFAQSRQLEAMERIMAFTTQYDFPRAFVGYLNPEGQNVAFITRYVITDYGITRANLRENISVYAQFLPIFSDAMAGLAE